VGPRAPLTWLKKSSWSHDPNRSDMVSPGVDAVVVGPDDRHRGGRSADGVEQLADPAAPPQHRVELLVVGQPLKQRYKRHAQVLLRLLVGRPEVIHYRLPPRSAGGTTVAGGQGMAGNPRGRMPYGAEQPPALGDATRSSPSRVMPTSRQPAAPRHSRSQRAGSRSHPSRSIDPTGWTIRPPPSLSVPARHRPVVPRVHDAAFRMYVSEASLTRPLVRGQSRPSAHLKVPDPSRASIPAPPRRGGTDARARTRPGRGREARRGT